jgi:hypothetical protein
MQKTVFALFKVALTLLITLPAKAEVVSKISPEFEASKAYWKEVNPQVGKYLNIPFFFNAPMVSFSPLPESVFSSRSARGPLAPVLLHYRKSGQKTQLTSPESQLGLRLITVKQAADRKLNSRVLAASGLFEPGDIVLSFRREWYRTLRYSHIQLGVSHAGLLYFETAADGSKYLKNMDMPLDNKHVGQGYLNSDHYLGAPLLHVVRARDLTAAQKENLNAWLLLIAKNGPGAYARGQLRFNQDYAAPKYDPKSSQPLDFVTDIGRIALGVAPSKTASNYCSEFAWAVLSLRNCNPKDENVKVAFQKSGTPSCVLPIFDPMPVLGDITTAEDWTQPGLSVGLADGVPLIAEIMSARITDPKKRNRATDEVIRHAVFRKADGGATNISSGHRAVEEGLLKNNPKFFDFLLHYFRLVNDLGANQNPEVLGIRTSFNQSQPLNYSPTAFMVHAILPPDTEAKRLDYVGTIFYAGKAQGGKIDIYEALRKLEVQ